MRKAHLIGYSAAPQLTRKLFDDLCRFRPRSCPRAWCNFARHVGFPVLPGCQVATAGKMTMGLSLTGAIPASIM